jgi:hypothetical protein
MEMSSDHQRFRASISFTGVITVGLVRDTDRNPRSDLHSLHVVNSNLIEFAAM